MDENANIQKHAQDAVDTANKILEKSGLDEFAEIVLVRVMIITNYDENARNSASGSTQSSSDLEIEIRAQLLQKPWSVPNF